MNNNKMNHKSDKTFILIVSQVNMYEQLFFLFIFYFFLPSFLCALLLSGFDSFVQTEIYGPQNSIQIGMSVLLKMCSVFECVQHEIFSVLRPVQCDLYAFSLWLVRFSVVALRFHVSVVLSVRTHAD